MIRYTQNLQELYIEIAGEMDLSIVIPVFNESKKIKRDIEAASSFLNNNDMRGEVIIVDDGSSDNTATSAEGLEVSEGINLKVIRLSQHKGKGNAVREGIQATKGDFVMFADSGCCVPYENVYRGLKMIKSGWCEIANGSRKLQESKINTPQKLHRRLYSMVFRKLLAWYLNIPAELTDTQCGFKIYRGDVGRRLYSQSFSNGFMFDVEIITRALRDDYTIKEFPVEWTCDKDSRFSLRRSFWQLCSELRRIKSMMGKE
jgi:dolichyl-phosphate beta-glucosyltransferase